MKRAIISMELPRQAQFEIEIQEPGTIHKFAMALRKADVILQTGQEVMEIPTILVEVNPDALKKKRRFAVTPLGQVLEAEKFEFRDIAASQSGHLWCLFEDTSLD